MTEKTEGPMKKLSDYMPAEAAKQYAGVLKKRREAYAAHLAQMPVPDDILNLAAALTAQHGETLQVWCAHLAPLEAFMVVRYGEEPAHWPKQFSSDDVRRAQEWLKGDVPAAVRWAQQHPIAA